MPREGFYRITLALVKMKLSSMSRFSYDDTPPGAMSSAKEIFQRDKACNIRPYPCIGMCMFLRPTVYLAKVEDGYEDILARVKKGARVLDVGCAMAQDLRALAADGAPTETMFGTGKKARFLSPLRK